MSGTKRAVQHGTTRCEGPLIRLLLGALVGLGLAVTAGGCSTIVGRFSILSTKNVELSRVDLKEIGLQRNVEGSDGRVWFLFIPLGFSPTVEAAADRVLEHGRGDFMVSARVEFFFWSFFLFSYESYRVYGDVGDSLGHGTRNVENAPGARGQEGSDQNRNYGNYENGSRWNGSGR